MMHSKSAAGPMGLALLLALGGPTLSAVKPHALFSDGAVLQRDAKVPIWGTADDGEEVSVRFGDREAKATAKDGKWRVELEPLKANGTPATLTIKGTNTVEVADVLVGDVWVCGGQSNMEWPLQASDAPESAISAADDAKLRLFTVPRKGEARPQSDVQGNWSKASPETVRGFTAVGYFFGRDLRKALDVPIGLISSNVGGTEAERWTSRKALESDPKLKDLAARTNVSDLTNAMIAPLSPLAIKGAIWYQGESNAGRAKQYRRLLPLMIKDWRENFSGGDFPFIQVQLAPFMKITEEPGESGWAELREAQRLITHDARNVGMVVITDVGDEADIHPRKKQPVGSRLALAARRLAYGDKDLVAFGPEFESLKVEGDRAILRFKDIGGGLVAKDGPLKGFAIAGEDRKYVNADATIEGDTVVVSSPKVEKPVAVRFGWANYPVVNLWNKEGLPATPFQTDDLGELP